MTSSYSYGYSDSLSSRGHDQRKVERESRSSSYGKRSGDRNVRNKDKQSLSRDSRSSSRPGSRSRDDNRHSVPRSSSSERRQKRYDLKIAPEDRTTLNRSNRNSQKYKGSMNDRRSDVRKMEPGRSRNADPRSPGTTSKIAGNVLGFASFLWEKSKVACFAIIAVLLILVLIFIDGIVTGNKIYQGVKVGDVDLSNMTIEEATASLNDRYEQKMFDTVIYVYADEESKEALDPELALLQDEALAEQISKEEASANRKLWIADALTLGAEFPAEKLAQEAFDIGRGDDPFARLGSFIIGTDIEPYAHYNDVLLSTMLDEIELSAGDPMLDYGISIDSGVAQLVEGHDGFNVDRLEFTHAIDDYFFDDPGTDFAYVPNIEYTPMKIDEGSAQKTADFVNAAIAGGASFTYADETIEVDAPTIGNWIDTRIERFNDEWKLVPYINSSKTTTTLVGLVNSNNDAEGVPVSIIEQDGEYIVQPEHEITIPSVEEAIDKLDDSLFSSFKDGGEYIDDHEEYDIPIAPLLYDGSFDIEKALAYGVIENFSSYTTNYNNKTSTANRTYNIHLAADLIDNSVAKANGGNWSFNEIAGDCNVEAGFRAAGTILDGELTDSIGGGVCQVATTVFNAVYDTGLPLVERHNHSLYISAYPDGRDAAVAYPTLDLIWQNDTDSDILLTTSYTDTSITVNLLGVNPGLTVETEVGAWEEGEKYTIKVEYEEGLSEGKSYIETKGQDGRVIEVKRVVKDSDGNTIREKYFVSVYSPTNMLIKAGPGSNKEEIKQYYEEQEAKKSSKSNSSSSSSSSSTSSSR